MANSALGHRTTPDRRATAFRLEGGYLTDPPETPLYLHGDIDEKAARVFVKYLETGIRETENRIDIRLDGVTFFGSDASRAVEEVVSLAKEHGRVLSIGGLPSIACDVLDVLGIDNPMIEREEERTVPLSPVVFDAVISRAVLRGREAVCVTTHDIDDPRIVFVNEAFSELTGYPADLTLGMNPKILQGPLTDRRVIEELKASVRSGKAFNGEAINYRANGSPFWMNWKIVSVSVGVRDFYVALQRDGTELRQLNRLQGARSRIERVQRAARGADMMMTLDALADAVALVVEGPGAFVTSAVTDPDGAVAATSSNAHDVPGSRYVGQRRRRSIEAESASLHLPADLGDGWTAHVRIDDVHPDWIRLVDEDHLDSLLQMGCTAITNRLDDLRR